mmetsp:Transcript_9935/g.15312  ORF Transcript_9935/g.15312 Transcript_9935/m.15312 type:complete len:196 (+) Transcript_9935:133-720(+)|eukprot:CAMPEP_0195280938 /NCGR_PEP_ID=MMETSP0707-20130614/447_1 /TAXON_ID=33640 /ORGANISM="Asterionellopsis glacialis, Strain CCMP134" /LENGTH=195 /DNA_ID=CAMNT_0040339767 /DNA_START=102 /DNA_END=689 /DNA_ORIENTATION=-
MVGRLFRGRSRRSSKRGGAFTSRKGLWKARDSGSSVNTSGTETESVSRSSSADDCRQPEEVSVVRDVGLSRIGNNNSESGSSSTTTTTPVLLSLASARRLPTEEQPLNNNTSSEKASSSVQLLGKINPQEVVKPQELCSLATAEASTPPIAPTPTVNNEKEYHGSPTINQLREKKRQRELAFSKRKLYLETTPDK